MSVSVSANAKPASSRPSLGAKFNTPEGFLVYPCIEKPDRHFDASGVFTAGIHLTEAELRGVETELRRIFSEAYPGASINPRLPIKVHPDSHRTLHTKSKTRPRIVNEHFRPVLSAEAGARVRILGRAQPYRFEDRAGVTVYLNTVQVIALEARDQHRERKRQEQEALRQAVAMARNRTGSR